MKVVVCPDKFKGSLDAPSVCEAVARALSQLSVDAVVERVPLADGGEGTCDLLTSWFEGSKIALTVHDPLFRPTTAIYGISAAGDQAFIEMAAASGLMLLTKQERNPLFTTSLGTGEMIRDALTRKVKNIVLGIGGSATNDAGIGMATALGYKFCDAAGDPLKPVGENLIHIRYIDTSEVISLPSDVKVVALCDVTNPLCGPEGAAAVYGPQKGADARAVALLDAGLRNFRRVVHKFLKTTVDFPGAGAAGGLGAGARVFLKAAMRSGVEYMIQTTGLAHKIASADLVITGEGKLDRQTLSGKVVSHVARLAREACKPVVVICGKNDLTEAEIAAMGIRKVVALADENTSPEFAMEHAAALVTEKLIRASRHVFDQ